MMNEGGKSDAAIVALRPANEAERSAEEPVERRAVTKGNADQQSTSRTLRRTKPLQPFLNGPFRGFSQSLAGQARKPACGLLNIRVFDVKGHWDIPSS